MLMTLFFTRNCFADPGTTGDEAMLDGPGPASAGIGRYKKLLTMKGNGLNEKSGACLHSIAATWCSSLQVVFVLSAN